MRASLPLYTSLLVSSKGSRPYLESKRLIYIPKEGMIFDTEYHFVIVTLDEYDASLFLAHTRPGGRLNKKDGLTRYGNSHVKDKTS